MLNFEVDKTQIWHVERSGLKDMYGFMNPFPGIGIEAGLPEVIVPGGYLEIELSSAAEFGELYYPTKNVVWVEGNIWRLYFEEDMKEVVFGAMIHYIGNMPLNRVAAGLRIFGRICLLHLNFKLDEKM